MTWLDVVHPSWEGVFADHISLIEDIEQKTAKENICPQPQHVLRAFSNPRDEMKVVIFGQDPYPKREHACGFAFSVAPGINPLPRSLQNIFTELRTDLGSSMREDGDLSDWVAQGVGLINRVLTVPISKSGGHRLIGWQKFTDAVARSLGESGAVAILWGNYAQELQGYFPHNQRIMSAHPSPLSAHRGFFGSKPFSKANQLLASQGEQAIDWLNNGAM